MVSLRHAVYFANDRWVLEGRYPNIKIVILRVGGENVLIKQTYKAQESLCYGEHIVSTRAIAIRLHTEILYVKETHVGKIGRIRPKLLRKKLQTSRSEYNVVCSY